MDGSTNITSSVQVYSIRKQISFKLKGHYVSMEAKANIAVY